MILLTLLPILTLLGYSLQFAKYSNVKLTIILPPTLSIIIILLYIAAILKILNGATWILYVGGVMALLSYFLSDTQTKFIKLQENFKEITAFSGLCILFAFYVQNKIFHAWDDFSHWGIFSLELLERNFFEYQNISTSIIQTHAHYPRGSAIYHYFFLLPSGYSDGGALFAHFILHLVFLSPLMQNRQLWQSLILVFLMLMITSLYTSAMRSTYNDSTIGIIFSAIFALNILETAKNRVFLLSLPVLILLPLFREIGLILGIFAAIILIMNHIRINGITNISISVWAFFLIILSLPIITNYLWMYYFKSTHDFFARTEHSFGNLINLAKSFDMQHKQLLINYLKFCSQFLVKEGSLVTYFLLGISWWGVKKYRKGLISEYKFYMMSLSIFFILFSFWRLYLYFFIFSYDEAIRGASLLRYLGSYCIVFSFISCAYIKQICSEINYTNFQKIVLYSPLTVALLIMAPSLQIIHTILRVKQAPLELEIRNQQLKIVKQFIIDNYEVDLDFENKSFDSLSCYYVNYKLAPYLKYDTLNICLKAPSIQREELKKLANFTTDYDSQNISPGKCKILYSPFINKLEVNCSE